MLIYSVICFQCNSQKIISNQKESNQFLKWLLKNQEEKIISKTPTKLNIGIIQRLSPEIKFSKKDILAIQKQIDENNKSTFDSSLYPDKRFVNNSELENIRKFRNYSYLSISKPLFIDNKILIIIENFCGIDCGSGEIRAYEIKKSTYKLLAWKRTWIS